MSYKPPKPEFELDELVIGDVKEPKIEFSHCEDCEAPIADYGERSCWAQFVCPKCGSAKIKSRIPGLPGQYHWTNSN